ncbi:SUN domain-containing ossification factor-like isoform X2 [Scleropages formosus]|uniref:SUN domain-containing ossification factor n=1 Tax=Scleropages formosus TaxID=113540 RepID=A0A8C9QY53_SCLFO|nr:SUN domain-containing ossification factor isoform X2 [Scleropages formosus]
MKKRLRVVSLCLAVALLRWYPSHVRCSDETSASPLLLAQDRIPEAKQEEGSEDKQAEEEWPTPAKLSYDVGLEAERALLEQVSTQDCREDEDRDQTVKMAEPAVPAKSEPVTDSEPEPQPESEPSASQDQTLLTGAAPATPAAAPETPEMAPGDILSTPTSHITTPSTPSSAIGAPSADSPVDSSVDAVQSAPDCEVTGRPVALSPSDPPPFGSKLGSLVEDHIENASSTQGHSKGTKTDLDLLTHVDQSVPELKHGGVTSHVPEEDNPPPDVPVVKETDPSVPSKEDIPTFDEWKKKVMEVEKEKSQSLHTTSSGSSHTVKKVQKNFNNYASVECGAKILSANAEAKSTSAILMENMDLYMLNPCSTKIWFVIELCEPIQVKQLDIANFELFSSTPKDFLVSISDRYPTNKWIKLGTFHARDERTVQSFPLDEQLYAKYVKVELISHFGSEHFCPLSLIRVFGTSMVEEYEEIAEPQYASERLEYLDEDYDYPPGYVPMEDKSSKNLLGSATNAILNMVNNIAANVLGATPELEKGADAEANFSTEAENVTITSTDSALRSSLPSTPSPAPSSPSGQLDTLGLSPSAKEEEVMAVTESPAPALPEESRIVTLVLEDEEEPSQSTVTLLEEEEEEESEEEPKEERGPDLRQQESLTQCGGLFALSCVATLQEFLHRCCSVAVARQRARSGHRKGRDSQARIHTVPALPNAPPSPSKQELPSHMEKDMETGHSLPKEEVVITVDSSSVPLSPLAKDVVGLAPEPTLLEPSQTASFPHFSIFEASLPVVTPTEQIPETSGGADLDTSARLLNGVPETQLDGRSPSTSSASSSTPSSLVEHPSLVSTQPDPQSHTMLEHSFQSFPTATQVSDVLNPSDHPVTFPETDADKLASEEPPRAGPVVEPSEAPVLHLEPKVEEPMEDSVLTPTSGSGPLPRTATDFYAELQNSSELTYSNGNGNQVHGSNQKESVFMRLNNRIKALEMNMSLSSRYLEELSQRYRKQMEEMQRAFNKTIIKLQNTSRIAEEQDQRQTESIQALQSQLENVTQLVLNLSLTVSQLQNEVSDRQSYLVVSLVLCLSLSLLLCIQCCRGSAAPPPNSNSSLPKSNHYPSPKRCFSSYDDMSLKRRVSCPLVRSKSFQFPPSEVGPDDLYIVEPLRFSPQKKKKRCKMKGDKVETLKPSVPGLLVANGGPKCNGTPPPPGEACPPPSKDPTSEGGSEGSCHSDEPLSSSQPAPMTRMEKKAFKRRRSRLNEQGRSTRELLPTLEDIMKGSKDMGIGTFGVTAVSGQV